MSSWSPDRTAAWKSMAHCGRKLKIVELHCVWRTDSVNVAMPAALSLLDRVVDEYEAV
jgi:hypothetical protein